MRKRCFCFSVSTRRTGHVASSHLFQELPTHHAQAVAILGGRKDTMAQLAKSVRADLVRRMKGTVRVSKMHAHTQASGGNETTLLLSPPLATGDDTAVASP